MNSFTRIGIFGLLSVSVFGCSGPSSDELKLYSEKCVEFYKEKRAENGEHVEYRSNWMKDGRLVISLAEKESKSDSSYTEGLCVIDLKEGTIELPGLFNQGRWDK
ncbi:MAG: hypothetical protein HOP06_09910 [Methylotenera sp.]|nr:hypothetical protein [Methylotenera sp.]NOT66320.1 hypothetical protein [Methylotenera sp.]